MNEYVIFRCPCVPSWLHSWSRESSTMKIHLSQPDRDIEIQGPKPVKAVLKELDIVPETVLVIRDDGLLTEDVMVRDTDSIEIRLVISGGM